ncbi:MAG: TIGR02444 family protein [Pseudorhodoplanes sp.]
MTGDHRDIASESWAFALRLYSAPGVSDACLKLQADAGVDVMLLLVASFAASQRRIRLTPADIRHMDAACGAWRAQVVHPLRQLRTVLKSGPVPAPSDETEKLRSQIKASELAAERLENDLLAHWLQRKTAHHRDLTRDEVGEVVHSVVRHFLGEAQAHRVVAMQSAVDTLLSAADKTNP